MIAGLVVSNLLVALVAFELGRRMRCRGRFNAGVAAGREAERLEHCWVEDPALRVPKRRPWSRLNRKPEPVASLPRLHHL